MNTVAVLPPQNQRPRTAAAPDSCANCQFFLPAGPMGGIDPKNLQAPARGLCRRYPPNAQITGMAPGMGNGAPPQAQISRAMVPVIGTEWCGEFARLQ